jgi:hypothetical protein
MIQKLYVWDRHTDMDLLYFNPMEQSSPSEAKSHYINYLPFMKPEVSLPCSYEPATGHYPKPDESSPQLPTLIPKDPF